MKSQQQEDNAVLQFIAVIVACYVAAAALASYFGGVP